MATSTYDYLTEEQRARRIPNSPPRSFAAFRDWYLKQGLGGGMGSDEWFTLLIARDADLDSLVYLRYLAETDRRKKEGLPARHPAPSFQCPDRHKSLYANNPLEFAHAIQVEQAERERHKRLQTRRNIRRWSKAGWSRNKMAAKLGGNRQKALALIRSVLG